MFSSRHVQTVHLSAPSEALLKRGAILLEDALHVASLPEPEGGQVLIVRSLNVGKIHPNQSSASLALAIEQRLRQLTSIAVYAEDPAAIAARVVYFRSEAEPYIRLASRIARQASTEAWFWSLAVPVWQPNLTQYEALRQILYGILSTPAGVMSVVALLEELLAENAIAPLLLALTQADGIALLRSCGWSQPEFQTAQIDISDSTVKTPWNELLQHWIEQWGVEDARSVWLAAIALLSEQPARILDQQLTVRSQQLLKQIAISRRFNLTELNLPRKIASEGIDTTLHQNETSGNTIDDFKAESQATVEHLQETHTTNDCLNSASESKVRMRREDAIATTNSNSNHSRFLELEHSDQPSSLTPRESPSQTIETTPVIQQDISQPTAYAGLFFLVQILNYLGIAEFLESHAHLIDLDLPRKLLHNIGQHLEIPDRDPIWAALTDVNPLAIPDDCKYVVPESWKRGTSLQQTWRIAMRRWCRRHAQMGLYNLVCRPGRIATTRTHIDIIFDHKQADIRIRRAGLDINPGWVLWLGKVVTFHYRYGEVRDAQ